MQVAVSIQYGSILKIVDLYGVLTQRNESAEKLAHQCEQALLITVAIFGFRQPTIMLLKAANAESAVQLW